MLVARAACYRNAYLDSSVEVEPTSPGVAVCNGREVGHNHRVASTTVEPIARTTGIHGRPSMVSVGTIVWLASELMFFAALFAAYFTIRSHAPDLWAQESAGLNFPYALGNTTILVLSSVTCQMGVFAAERGEVGRSGSLIDFRKWGLREWFTLTFVMGAVFVAGQATEYAHLVHEGLGMATNGYGSIFYLATGFHGLHVTGGLFAFLLVLGRTFMARRFTHEQAVSAIVVSYYWHFVDVVWIALFATIYVLK
jgi:cytochrome c oxidase subunit III